ncbi:hypothetical protein ABZY09_39270 [Streptomyces sp. NPDC002928]|uniref:hypothetical protein n=1 Tax=Streptomyces sp. NPDC002928 TaxID=3154440 RepID=UPI0033B1B3E5
MTADGPEKVAAIYLAAAKDQVGDERSLKASLEQRALLVITTSGALVALQFAIAAVRTRVQAFAVPGIAVTLLIASLCLFVLSAGSALAINLPVPQLVVPPATLEDHFAEGWNERELHRVLISQHETEIAVLGSLRAVNRRKAALLNVALAAELLAVALIAVAVAITLTA